MMMRRIGERVGRGERGFTLPEVLVVIIIIGILAAIAYAVFIGQRTKANDAEAKDHVSALAIDVESCRVDTGDFTECATKAQLNEGTIPIDAGVTATSACSGMTGVPPNPRPAKGEVAVVGASKDCYLAMGQTQDGHLFWVLHESASKRYCTPPGPGGCHDDPSTSDPLVGNWSNPN